MQFYVKHQIYVVVQNKRKRYNIHDHNAIAKTVNTKGVFSHFNITYCQRSICKMLNI